MQNKQFSEQSNNLKKKGFSFLFSNWKTVPYFQNSKRILFVYNAIKILRLTLSKLGRKK